MDLLSTIRTYPLYIISCSVKLTIRWREDSTKLIKCCIFLHQLNVEGDEDLEEQGTIGIIILVKTNFLWFLFNGFRYICFSYATLVCSVLGKLVLTKEWAVDQYFTLEVEYKGCYSKESRRENLGFGGEINSKTNPNSRRIQRDKTGFLGEEIEEDKGNKSPQLIFGIHKR